jgi:hypothetical protein
MIAYEVVLSRTVTVTSRVKVEVEAGGKIDAGAKALALAEEGKVTWSETLGEAPLQGEIKIETVIPVVDLDFADEEIEP